MTDYYGIGSLLAAALIFGLTALVDYLVIKLTGKRLGYKWLIVVMGLIYTVVAATIIISWSLIVLFWGAPVVLLCCWLVEKIRRKPITFKMYSKALSGMLFLCGIYFLAVPYGQLISQNLFIFGTLWLLLFGLGVGGNLASNFLPAKELSQELKETREHKTKKEEQTKNDSQLQRAGGDKKYSRYFLIYVLPGMGIIALYVIIQLILANVPRFTRIVNISYWLIFVLTGVGLIGFYFNKKEKMQNSTPFKVVTAIATVGMVTAIIFSVHTKIMNDRYKRAFDDFDTDYRVLKARVDLAETLGDEPEDDYDGDGSTNGSEDSSHILKNMDKNLEVMLRNNTGTYNIRKVIKHYDDMDDEFNQW
ncbi:hypothetical protein [Limosilactobacillus fermentum]|uniref:hypothetical protein n=1 Tax=Limosilactobacillus fermentum TaxID=1613 RepID=UPI001E4ACCFA|nr:hypothetical protein [Limosilactobacillus fermentum]MCD5424400.1 hypothetical protein [Limosilactobacillus fermentum]